jgi:putative hydrolase of the HAD superfamily
VSAVLDVAAHNAGFTPRPLDAITFDYWNTLMAEETDRLREERIERVLAVLGAAGHPLTRAELEAVFERSWKAFNQAWKDNVQYTNADATEALVGELGEEIGPELREQLNQAMFGGPGRTLRATANIGACLAALKDAGLRIGIVCDVGMTPSPMLREHLERHDLLRYFDHWSFSDEVGVYKPDPTIFEHALAGLDATAERAAHVGDLRRTDVLGAKQMGMVAVRYTGVADDDDTALGEGHTAAEGDLVVHDHADLPALLGVA